MLFSSGNYVPDQYYASLGIPMNVGQGLVGKAALYRKPFFCRDVSQLSITQFPFVHCARRLRLKGCFAVCLRTISTRNHEYVVEFFLPRKGTYMRDHHNFLSSILTTMKQHLKTFEAVTQDLGNELFIEVDNFSIHKEFEALKKFPTINAQLEFEALQNGGMVLQSDQSIGRQLEIEDIDVAEQPEIGISLERIPQVKQSKAQNLEKESLCSRKDLKQHIGTKLKDAAESVGVSRSTVKRWCGEHNINKWSSSKRSKVCSSSFSPQQTNVVCRGNAESISQVTRREPLCSETPTNVALMPATNMITIKVPYGNLFIAFKLSYSSRMTDLVEKVVIRTGLAKGTFCMAYLDEENDPILVASDEDLQDCMNTWRLSGKTIIRMQIESIADKSS